MALGNAISLGFTRGTGVIPTAGKALFWLDGTLSGSEFVDRSGNGRNFTITGKDFDFAGGFPYKSAATISAPVGDATLIAADINNFLYTAGTPNEIPVVSFFQNIDYENKLFTRHVAQALDGNGVETTEPVVTDIVLYQSVLTGADLTASQTYYEVPTEVTTNVKWIDPQNGSDAAAGTKAAPYETFATAIAATTSGGTIYITTGDLNEICTVLNKGVSVISIGLVDNLHTTRGFSLRSNITTPINISGMLNSGANSLIVPGTGAVAAKVTVDRCKFVTLGGSLTSTGDIEVKNSVFNRVTYKCPLVTLVNNNITGTDAADGITLLDDLVSTNNNYLFAGNTTVPIKMGADTTSISCLGDVIGGDIFSFAANTNEVAFDLSYCTLTPRTSTGKFISLTSTTIDIDLNISYTTFTSEFAGTIDGIYTRSPGDIDIHHCTFTNLTQVINAVAQVEFQTLDFNSNTCTSDKFQALFITDYEVSAHHNIMHSEVYSSFYDTRIAYTSTSEYYNNYMASEAEGAPFIVIGTEYDNVIDGYMNGTEVYNNRFSGPTDFGNDPGAMHGVFVWSHAVNFYYNKLSGSNLGFVAKSDGGTHACVFRHNLVEDTAMSYTVKGMKGVSILNNVSKNASFFNGLAETHAGDEGDSGNTTIKNNIATGVIKYLAFDDATQLVGLDSDYNVFYNASDEDVFRIDTDYYDLAEWQALDPSYDPNSQRGDPLLDTDLIPGAGSPAIGAGETLAATYDDGLDASTDWGDSDTVPSVVTKQQTGSWDIGAYVS